MANVATYHEYRIPAGWWPDASEDDQGDGPLWMFGVDFDDPTTAETWAEYADRVGITWTHDGHGGICVI